MFTKKDFAVGDVVVVKLAENYEWLFNHDFNSEGLYKVHGVYDNYVTLTKSGIRMNFDSIKQVKVPHEEPWVEVGDTVTLKDEDSLSGFYYVTSLMTVYAGKSDSVYNIGCVYFNDEKDKYEQNICLTKDNIWIWKNECFVSNEPKVIGKPKYRSYADLVKFTTESVRVIRCKNCRYWHPEIVSSISNSLCLCELNSPKFPKTDYGYFTKAEGFCPSGAPDPDRDYGYGKLSEINPKYSED